MRGSIRVGTLFGIPLRLHWSAPALILVLGIGLAAQTLPAWVPGRSGAAYAFAGLVGALLLMAGLLLHEAAHAVTARRAGVRVEDMTVFALGGVTRIGTAPTARRMLKIAGVGPLTSLAIGVVSTGAGFGMGRGLHWDMPAAVLLWNGWANLLLGVFNLLPAAPLDGGRILQSALWARSGDRARAERASGRSGQVTGVLLAVLGWLEFVRNDAAGLWIALVGLFIWTSATAEIRRTDVLTALRGTAVRDLMSVPSFTAADWLGVDRLLADLAPHVQQPLVPTVDFEGRPSGLADLRRIVVLPAARRAALRVRDVAKPLGECLVAAPSDDLVQVLEKASVEPPILVVEGRQLVGVVTIEDIVRAARMQRVIWRGKTGSREPHR